MMGTHQPFPLPLSGLQGAVVGQKRYVCPSPPKGAPKAKRSAFGDLTNKEPSLVAVREEDKKRKDVSGPLRATPPMPLLSKGACATPSAPPSSPAETSGDRVVGEDTTLSRAEEGER